ncbi:MAG: hypothetical protein GY862_09720 [Gammaproteobacteria bacterium]|nr:hypothetical protein [Gammaproteobacteria bacterium]
MVAKSTLVAKVRKWEKTLEELHTTNWAINITRLSSAKSLCRETGLTREFVLYLAEKTLAQLEARCPKYTKAGDWENYKEIMREGIAAMQAGAETAMRASHRRAQKLQNEIERQGRTAVRVIHSRHVLLLEQALECCFYPNGSERTYDVARSYAERYDGSYGTGLIPESAPFLEDIIMFWKQRGLIKRSQR